jgi:pimeloyl-ACP methyl ester carboxylesterase
MKQHASDAQTDAAPRSLYAQWLQYCGDALWRSAATMDTLRERAENIQQHEAAGMPPLLHFEAEEVADAHAFSPPSNYRLLRITRCGSDGLERFIRADAAPVIVVDPRAGHGPGIGGFRRDSEVGMALREGHPVYFVVFDPLPVEGQTVSAVVESVARFIALVCQRHPRQQPIVYGNCQGGWAVMMALSHCGRRTGLAVLNGSPLSYWAGAPGVNPMRLGGAFGGGAWLAHLAADLGAGRFDGAALVQNFELLQPEAVWKKYDGLWAQPELEHDRFLEFERWWNAFYFLGREEILSIVRDLFIGNKLERGEVVVDGHCRADLRQFATPLVIFCSWGDNITPPHQALGWLRAIHGTTADLVACGQRIVYLLDGRIGHLGIFVSGEIALRQHRAILHHATDIQALPPGLYEMRIDPAGGAVFEARKLEDIAFDPQPSGFSDVQQLSEALDGFYGAFISPWVRLAASRESAELLARWHPMRVSRRCFSPHEIAGMAVLPRLRQAAQAAALEPEQRHANPWYQAERIASEAVHDGISAWRQWRDMAAEVWFHVLFGLTACESPEGSSHPRATSCPSCKARHLTTGATACCESAEHCAILNGSAA